MIKSSNRRFKSWAVGGIALSAFIVFFSLYPGPQGTLFALPDGGESWDKRAEKLKEQEEKDRKARLANPDHVAAINKVADYLDKMGRKDVGDKLRADFESGRVYIGKIGANAEVNPGALGAGRSLVLSDSIINQLTPPKGQAPGAVVAGWSLTVFHEYVHMKQWMPMEDSSHETPAWGATLRENGQWIRKTLDQIDQTGSDTSLTPQAREDRLKDLRQTLADLQDNSNVTLNEIRGKLKTGDLDGNYRWQGVPPAGGGEATGIKDINIIEEHAGALVKAGEDEAGRQIAKAEKEISSKQAKPVSLDPETKTPGATTGDAPGWGAAASAGLQSIKETVTKGGEALKDSYDKAKAKKAKADKKNAEKEKEAKEKADKEKAEKEKAKKEKAAKEKASADKLAKGPVIPSGAHEEVSGWAEDKNGRTRLTYIKDANGNVLSGYKTHFDPDGNEIGRETFTGDTTPESSPPEAASPESDGPESSPQETPPTGIAKIVGVWTGQFGRSIAEQKGSGEQVWYPFALTFGADGTVTIDGPLEFMQGYRQKLMDARKSSEESEGNAFSFSCDYETNKTLPFSYQGNTVSVGNTLFITETVTENSAKEGSSAEKATIYLSLTGAFEEGAASGTLTVAGNEPGSDESESSVFTWQANKS